MAQFKAFDSKTEVNGETVNSIIDGMGTFKQMAVKILAENGIVNCSSGSWYPQQSWLNAFKAISEKVGQRTLIAIGTAIPRNAKFPPQINNIEKALSAIDVAYHMNHRVNNKVLFDPASGRMSEGIGHYTMQKMEDKKIKMVCNNPYPCQFDLGIIKEMAEKFKPTSSTIVDIKHDDSVPCRNKGADSCTYIVTWK